MGQHRRPVPPLQSQGHHLSGATEPPSTPSGVAGAAPDDPTSADAAANAADDAARRVAWLEAGRLHFAAPFAFERACHDLSHLPAAGPSEVAFAGRSNVGKSSLINALVDQKGLARASNTPGRTRALNLFARPDGVGLTLVDMPGYGYARASKQEVAAWTALVFDYLRGRPSLRRVFLLIDARHGIKPNDTEAMGVLDEAAVSYQLVLTKADKPKPADLDAVASATLAAIAKRPAAHPELLVTSADRGTGIDVLRATVAALAEP